MKKRNEERFEKVTSSDIEPVHALGCICGVFLLIILLYLNKVWNQTFIGVPIKGLWFAIGFFTAWILAYIAEASYHRKVYWRRIK